MTGSGIWESARDASGKVYWSNLFLHKIAWFPPAEPPQAEASTAVQADDSRNHQRDAEFEVKKQHDANIEVNEIQHDAKIEADNQDDAKFEVTEVDEAKQALWKDQVHNYQVQGHDSKELVDERNVSRHLSDNGLSPLAAASPHLSKESFQNLNGMRLARSRQDRPHHTTNSTDNLIVPNDNKSQNQPLGSRDPSAGPSGAVPLQTKPWCEPYSTETGAAVGDSNCADLTTEEADERRAYAMSLKLAIDIDTIGQHGSVQRAAFEHTLKSDLLKSTGLRPTGFTIRRVAADSVLVDGEILHTGSAGAPCPRDIAADLLQQAKDPKSSLLNGSITRFIESVNCTPIDGERRADEMYNDVGVDVDSWQDGEKCTENEEAVDIRSLFDEGLITYDEYVYLTTGHSPSNKTGGATGGDFGGGGEGEMEIKVKDGAQPELLSGDASSSTQIRASLSHQNLSGISTRLRHYQQIC